MRRFRSIVTFGVAAMALCAGTRGICAADRDAAPPGSWRGGMAGLFASARPPVEWENDAKLRVVAWKADVGSGLLFAIVVGDRCFVASDPDRLLCSIATLAKSLGNGGTHLTDLPNGAGGNWPSASRPPPPADSPRPRRCATVNRCMSCWGPGSPLATAGRRAPLAAALRWRQALRMAAAHRRFWSTAS